MTLAIAIGALTSTAAFANGQWNDVPDHVRSGFKSVRSHGGGRRCDIADGHRTDWEIRPAGYFIPNPADPTVHGSRCLQRSWFTTRAIRPVKRSYGGIQS